MQLTSAPFVVMVQVQEALAKQAAVVTRLKQFPNLAGRANDRSVALGPLFLGTLYQRLDMLQHNMTRSFSRYEVSTYLSTYFLEMFIFERFPKCAPKPNKLPAFHEKKFIVDEAGNLVLDEDGKEQPLP